MVLMPKFKKPFDEKEKENFISNGTAEVVQKEIPWTNIILRIKQDALVEVDMEVKKRMGLSRNAWILEAIQDKLKELSGRETVRKSGDAEQTS